ncbi:MAG: hypothetical protein H6622_13985 [Halobacteriovoraceae bacterium]|nr:hypothetical protein [Halobacteriovoraceae bacterium]
MTFFILFFVKAIANIFYKVEYNWLDGSNFDDFKNVRIIAFLNHTSLYEPLFLAPVPIRVLWEFSKNMVACAADITINRPIVGLFWNYFAPEVVSITRKRDETWQLFLKKIQKERVIVTMAPEGRMMRKTGLDKDGKQMSIKSGIADVLPLISKGEMVIIYSGGLHHVQTPGEIIPKIFKTIKMNLERVDIKVYMTQFESNNTKKQKVDIVKDLAERMKKNVPKNED